MVISLTVKNDRQLLKGSYKTRSKVQVNNELRRIHSPAITNRLKLDKSVSRLLLSLTE